MELRRSAGVRPGRSRPEHHRRIENAHFPNATRWIDFVSNGSENGVGYGEQGQGSGKMPAFGAMLTEEQISAIVDYVRSL